MCEKGTHVVARCWELLLEYSRAIEISFEGSRKIMIFVTKSESHAFSIVHLNINAVFHKI